MNDDTENDIEMIHYALQDLSSFETQTNRSHRFAPMALDALKRLEARLHQRSKRRPKS